MPRLWNSVDASGGSERVPKVRLDPAQFLLAQFRPPVANLTSSSAKVFTPLSIPADMPEMPFQWTSTYSSWLQIINSATSSIDIACYYMTLTDGSVAPPGQGGYMGSSIFQSLVAAAHNRGVRIRIVQQLPDARMPAYDTGNLTAMGLATVRSIDFSTIMGGIGGILHTKMMIVDGKHGYVGSANLDWRSLSQVKELGIMVTDCDIYANDLGKIFEEYWTAAAGTQLPSWPSSLYTVYNNVNPMIVNGQPLFISSGPAPFAPSGRVNDLDALLGVINGAKSTLKFAVMDYTPTSMYYKQPFYWPPVDDALRAAAFRGVKVQLMFSVWNHTNFRELPYWRSLDQVYNVNVKTYRLNDSPFNPQAPFSRVSHSKYVITDNAAYVTTSNCGADYYLSTGGVSVNLLSNSPAYQTIDNVFNTDWNSQFAGPIPLTVPRSPRKPFVPKHN